MTSCRDLGWTWTTWINWQNVILTLRVNNSTCHPSYVLLVNIIHFFFIITIIIVIKMLTTQMRIQRMFSATKVRGFRVIGQVQWIKRVFQFHIQYILSKQVMYIIISLDVHRIFYIKCALWIQNNTKFFFSACLCSPTLTNPIKISIVTDTDTHQRNTFLHIFIFPRPDVCDCALGKSSKKRLVLVRLTVRADPPSRPLTVSFTWFFWVWIWPSTMIICVLRRILHKKKVYFHLTTRSPNYSILLCHKIV